MEGRLNIISSRGKTEHASPVIYYFQFEVGQENDSMLQTVLPAVYFDIIFPPGISVVTNGKEVLHEKPFVAPVLHQGKQVRFTKGSKLFGIRLRPEYSTLLFDIKGKEFYQGPNDFNDVVNRKYKNSMLEIAQGNMDFIEKVRRLNPILADLHLKNGANVVRQSLDFIKSKQHIQVSDLSLETKFTSRWLEMKFMEYLGASPSEIIKIVRFNRFLKALQKNNRFNLTQLALDSGYYDQSHLIHDFKLFSSSSPGYYKKNYPLISKVLNHL